MEKYIISPEFVSLVCCKQTKEEVIKELVKQFNYYFPLYEINNKNRICAFIAQVAYETGYFVFFHEIGNIKYFEKYEPPSRLAAVLGNTEKGDGAKFRGHGLIQLTGRRNHQLYGDIIGVDLIDNPNKAEEIPIATQIACEYWNRNKLSQLADKDLFAMITKRINGSIQSFPKREPLYKTLKDNFDKCFNI